MTRMHDRIQKLESRSPARAQQRVTAWLQECEDGPLTNRDSGETLSLEEWTRWASETDGIHIRRTLVSPRARAAI
jgi:hypothetical protein